MYMMSDLKWTEKRINKTLSELFEKPFVMHCDNTETLFLPKHLELHPLQNLNQAKGAAKIFKEVNNNFSYISHLAKALLESKYVNDPVLEGFRKGLERVANDITITVTVTEPVTEPVTEGENDAPQAALLDDDGAPVVPDDFNVENSFTHFWKMWPKRGDSRTPAEKKFCVKVKTQETCDDVMRGLDAQMPQFQRRLDAGENNFIPAAATWLNQERWNNEPEPPPGGGPGGGNFGENDYGGMSGGLK